MCLKGKGICYYYYYRKPGHMRNECPQPKKQSGLVVLRKAKVEFIPSMVSKSNLIII
jgi:hypothetical protein